MCSSDLIVVVGLGYLAFAMLALAPVGRSASSYDAYAAIGSAVVVGGMCVVVATSVLVVLRRERASGVRLVAGVGLLVLIAANGVGYVLARSAFIG